MTNETRELLAILCYYPVYREIRIVWSFIEILCVNIINSNSLFTHCLRKSKKKAATKFVTAWFPLWTSLGLNQGPPDYESVALTNWATSPMYPFIGCGDKSSIFYWIMQILSIKNYVTFLLKIYICVSGSWGTSLFLLFLPVRKPLWLSRKRRRQIRLAEKLWWRSRCLMRQLHRQYRVSGISTSILCPNAE